MPSESAMDAAHSDLIGALFAAATAKLESAHAASVAGQRAGLPASDLGDCAANIRSGSADAATLVSAATKLAGCDSLDDGPGE
jgi:hypothetical protein